MLYKYLFSDRMSQARKLYILVGVVIPLAIVAVVSAWAEGNIRTVIAMLIVSVGWSVGVFSVAREIKRYVKPSKTYHADKVTPHLRRIIPLIERIFWLLILIVCVVFLVITLVKDRPLYVILEIVLIIIISGGHLLFVSLVPDEWTAGRKS